MMRALGIALVVALGILAGCRGGPSAHPPAADQPVARASVPESDASALPPTPALPSRAGGGSESLAVETTAFPALSATIWKRETIGQEPILLKLEVTNSRDEEVKIVAPYMNGYGRANYPLTLAVTDASGAAVPNGWEYSTTGSEPIHRGSPWWIPDGRVQPGDTEPREWRAWRIPPGETAYMWYNVLQFYPIDDPGEYHIVLKYDSKPEMLFQPGQKKDNPPKDVLCWWGQVDAGWVTVREPGPRDAEACAKLRENPDVQGCVFSTNFAWGHGDGHLLDREGDKWKWLNGTTYEPYVRFARAFYKGGSPSPRDAAGLPLAELLRTVAPRMGASRRAYGGPYEHLKQLRADPIANAEKIRDMEGRLRQRAESALEAQEQYIEEARAVGDYSLLGRAEKPMEVIRNCIKVDFPDWPN